MDESLISYLIEHDSASYLEAADDPDEAAIRALLEEFASEMMEASELDEEAMALLDEFLAGYSDHESDLEPQEDAGTEFDEGDEERFDDWLLGEWDEFGEAPEEEPL